MHVLYHHRTAGDRVELVHIMGTVSALRDLGHTVEISSPPGCDPERAASCEQHAAMQQASGFLRKALKGVARKAPPVLFEFGVDVVAGTRVVDPASVLRSVSQGATFRQIEGVRLLTMRR